MSGKSKKSNSTETPKPENGDPVVNARVQELTWALIDEQITDDEFELLETLLLSDDHARSTYIDRRLSNGAARSALQSRPYASSSMRQTQKLPSNRPFGEQ